MPSDVIGGNVWSQPKGAFEFFKGPVFAQLLLADEINRAPAKTQSALLEAMQERQVTVDGVSRPLPDPFLVMATQNPIESQGTYPLPEAQLDRFMFKLAVLAPSHEIEMAILRNHLAGFDAQGHRGAQPRTRDHARGAAGKCRRSHGSCASTRASWATSPTSCAAQRGHRSLYYGASPRASIALLHGAQARAASRGRDFVSPDDVKALAPAVLRHRVGLQPDAEIEGMSTDDCVAEILRDVRVPETIAA